MVKRIGKQIGKQETTTKKKNLRTASLSIQFAAAAPGDVLSDWTFAKDGLMIRNGLTFSLPSSKTTFSQPS